ncbi:hypothetical protein BT96DRAFT_915796 [Gymnopus androsaceus JB14]|uniref:Mid2 domain-containing protein n=1 Tax=Gymnopus androsaceus JB14 TaxID=1447944 RepID=A0A6A4I5N3_9AGAR|nr:hypothetical protein BT96DRAFT_915796 [Gymnopus androsaceus JB14]
MFRSVNSFVIFSLSFFALTGNAFLVTLEGASTATAPVTVTGTFQRQAGDPSGITINVIDISTPSGPTTIQTEDPPNEESGSFQVALTTPGSAILGTSNAITVLSGSTDTDTDTQSSTTTTHSTTTQPSSTDSSTSSSDSTAPLSPSSTDPQTSNITTSTSTSTSPTDASTSSSNSTAPLSPSSIDPRTSATTTSTSTSTSPPSANDDSGSQSQRTGQVVGGVIGGLVLLILLLVFLCYFFRFRRRSRSQWLNSLPGAGGSTRRRWYRISRGASPRESILPFTRNGDEAEGQAEVSTPTDVGENQLGAVVRERSAIAAMLSGGVPPVFTPHMDAIPHVGGTSVLLPGYDSARDSGAGSSPMGELPWPPPPSFAASLLKGTGRPSSSIIPSASRGYQTDGDHEIGLDTSSRLRLSALTDMDQDDPPPSYASHSPKPKQVDDRKWLKQWVNARS